MPYFRGKKTKQFHYNVMKVGTRILFKFTLSIAEQKDVFPNSLKAFLLEMKRNSKFCEC